MINTCLLTTADSAHSGSTYARACDSSDELPAVLETLIDFANVDLVEIEKIYFSGVDLDTDKMDDLRQLCAVRILSMLGEQLGDSVIRDLESKIHFNN